MAGENNPFYVAPVNPLQALMAGEQGYQTVSGAMKQNRMETVREQAAQSIMQGGNPQSALAQLLSIGDDKGAATLASVIHQKSQQEFQQQQLAQQATHFGISSSEAARHNKATEALAAQAQNKPMVLPFGSGLVDRSGNVLREPTTDGLLDSDTITAMAHQLKAGDTSVLTNLGRGAQGAQNVIAVRKKVAELNAAEGRTGADQANTNAVYGGVKAGERTKGTREAGLDIILKATEAAIPAALEASDNVERYAGKFVPLNQIIQKGQVMTSDANLRKFGMANLQLAEHWARAMNPTGVMRESDRDMALSYLSTADTKDTYRQVVNQLKMQIQREKDAIKGSHAGSSAAAPPPPPVPSQGGQTAQATPGAVPALPPGFQLVR